ncbi:family 13 glycoside hydrolase [Cryphonectria parasitica EP155]|uniref:Family 13 glycoside hydrolase n=1 Tax=Cryphonectria parasitica (strain ATCC 38755 / EP155) TaxID=660469 RepID=A0A9P4XWU4_CRYP1|nr:family 13 glycoside hydrolase [Cryphonectria parasitica EP155]KAF3762759.1 family 13 glycoside hydrolase [Cryphonectria parasitica EP155]
MVNFPPLPLRRANTNQTMFQGFEWYVPSDQKHWQRLDNALPSLEALGITSIWIPPACKAGWHTSNGYDLYDLFDLGEFDQKGGRATKWGTKEELIALAERARGRGISILFDAVLNHKASADRAETVLATKVDPKNRLVSVGKPGEIEAWCGYDFPGRGSGYSPLRWNQTHFNGIDYCHHLKTHGVWKFEGKEWAQDVDEELGNYDYLMFANVDHRNPEVRQDLFYWVQWLAQQIPLGGLRLDAIKHYSASFLRDFLRHVRATVGKNWFIVGEYWRENLNVLAKYIEYMDHCLSLFDVRLVSNFSRLSRHQNTDLRSVFDGTLVSLKPNNAVTFVANHDTMEGQSLETPVAEFFVPLAYALILLRANCGLPCVFYGDLYGYSKPDGSGFAQPPFGEKTLPRLLLARKLYAYGPQIDYLDQPHCIGFTRQGQAPHPADGGSCTWKRAGLAVIMTNAREFGSKAMCVGKQHAGEIWTDILGGCWGEVRIDDEGWGVFGCAPRSVAVWVHRHAPRRDELDNFVLDWDIYRRGAYSGATEHGAGMDVDCIR